MFLLVSKYKMIGMLLNIVHGQVQKKLTKLNIWTKSLTGCHSTSINNYDAIKEKIKKIKEKMDKNKARNVSLNLRSKMATALPSRQTGMFYFLNWPPK